MIPKWKDMRKQYLSPIGSKEEADNYVNTSQKAVYLTWLSEDDPKYGEDSTYESKYKQPQRFLFVFVLSVNINQQQDDG